MLLVPGGSDLQSGFVGRALEFALPQLDGRPLLPTQSAVMVSRVALG